MLAQNVDRQHRLWVD